MGDKGRTPPQGSLDPIRDHRGRGDGRGHETQEVATGMGLRLDKATEKTLLWLAGICFALLNGFILYRFSEEFEKRFDKSIVPTQENIKRVERDLEDLEKEIKDLEKELDKVDNKVIDIQIRLGGKR